MRERDRHACPKPDIAPIEQARTQRRRQPRRPRPLPCTGPVQSWTHSRSQTPARAGTPPGRRAYCLELAPWAHGRAPRAPCPTDSPGPSAEAVRRRRSRGPPTGHGRRLRRARPGAAAAPGRRHAQPGGTSGRQRPGRRRVGARLPALRRAGRTKAAGTYAERAAAPAHRPGSACHRGPRGCEPLRTGRTEEALHLLERCAHLTAGSRPPAPGRRTGCAGMAVLTPPAPLPNPNSPLSPVISWLSLSGPLSPGDFVAQPQWSALAW